MKSSLQHLLRECLREAKEGAGMDPLKYPAQVHATECINFTLIYTTFISLFNPIRTTGIPKLY